MSFNGCRLNVWIEKCECKCNRMSSYHKNSTRGAFLRTTISVAPTCISGNVGAAFPRHMFKYTNLEAFMPAEVREVNIKLIKNSSK